MILCIHQGWTQKALSGNLERDSIYLETLKNQVLNYGNYHVDSALLFANELGKSVETYLKKEQNAAPFYLDMLLNVMTEKALLLLRQGKLEEGLELAKKMHANWGEDTVALNRCTIYRALGILHAENGNLDSSVVYFEQAVAWAKRKGNEEQYVYGLGNLAQVLMQKGEFEEALKLHQDELEYAKRVNDTASMSDAWNSMANIYNAQNDLIKARFYYQKSLKYTQANQNLNRLAGNYFSIGETYYMEQAYDTATTFFEKSLALYRKVGNEMYGMIVFGYLADIEQQQGKHQSALEKFKQMLAFFEQTGDPESIIQALIGVGSLHLKLGNLEQSQQHLEEAFELAETYGFVHKMRGISATLGDLYAQQGAYEKAYEMSVLHVSIQDSLINSERDKKIIQLEESYKYQVQFAKDSIQNAELQKVKDAELVVQQQRVNFLILGLMIVLVLGGFAFNRYQVTRRQKKVIDEAYEDIQKKNEEKEVLLKEIHHRVKNNLQIISSLLDLQGRSINDQATATAITDGQNRVKSMALIHQKLYQNENIAAIHFKDYVEQLLHQLLTMYKIDTIEKTINIADDRMFDIDTAIPLGLILNELFTNSCKYAFSNDRTNAIQIALSSDAEGSYQLDIKDNGAGMPEGFDIWEAESLGLRLVGRLSEQLFGDVTYQTNDGAHFSIAFKDTALRKTMD